MLIAKEISLYFGTRPLFDKISFNLNQDQKVGLVGRNGSGKTTLLKVLAGTQKLDSGLLEFQRGIKIAYLPQELVLLSDKNVLDEAFSVFEELQKIEKEIHILEKSDLHVPENLERYTHLQEIFLESNYSDLLIKTKKVLNGLGFLEEVFDNSVSNLSVGWKMRLVLAKLLLQDADFYLFDEPTNHLDLVAKDWFFNFLKNAKFGFMLVSHDRFFLDNACEYTFEVDRGNLTIYHTNYTDYLDQKERTVETIEKKYEEQQKFIKKQQDLIDRFKAKASKAKMAQSLAKSLEKIELIVPPAGAKKVRFSFPEVKRSGDIVLSVEDLSKTFGDKSIFKNVTFQIKRGQKVAIVASNGMGKSTMLNLIVGKYDLESGSVKFGHNVDFAYFEQDQNKALNLNKSVLQEVEDGCKDSETRQKVRPSLGAFLFSGDDVDKRVGVLSGGEKNRVAMVKVLLKNANFLILDEPTNHLDLESKEILLNVLKSFNGTILFVSHDRTFLNSLADHIIELTPQRAFCYEGDYDSYLYQKEEYLKNLNSQNSGKDKNKEQNTNQIKKVTVEQEKISGKQAYENKKKRNSFEGKIKRLETEKKDLVIKFENLQYQSDDYYKTQDRLKEIDKILLELYAEWESLS